MHAFAVSDRLVASARLPEVRCTVTVIATGVRRGLRDTDRARSAVTDRHVAVCRAFADQWRRSLADTHGAGAGIVRVRIRTGARLWATTWLVGSARSPTGHPPAKASTHARP